MPVNVLLHYYSMAVANTVNALDIARPYFIYLFWAAVAYILFTFAFKLVIAVRDYLQPQALLVLTPPKQTSISAATTGQFFELFHGLASHKTFLERLTFVSYRYSFEMVSSKSGGIRYLLRIPKGQTETVTKTLRGYLPGLQIGQADDYQNLGRDIASKVLSFKLSGHFAKPLAEHTDLSVHDPISYLANNMTQLGANEIIALQIAVRPIHWSREYSAVRKIKQLRHLIKTGRLNHPEEVLSQSALQSVLMGSLHALQFVAELVTAPLMAVADAVTGGNTTTLPGQIAGEPVEMTSPSETESMLVAQIGNKLKQPLYCVSIRSLLVVDKNQVRSREQGLSGSFSAFSSSHGQRLVPQFDFAGLAQRLRHWQFRNRLMDFSGNILSSSELASLYHFPQTDTSETEDLVRVRSRELPAPLAFKQTAPYFDNTFASNNYSGVATQIGLTLEERRRHTYVLGATGSGKTTLLSTMIHQDIVNGKGVAVIDPHGQLVEQILRTIPKERIKDVVWFAPDDDGYPIALNFLDLPLDADMTLSQREKQKSLVVSSINSIFQKFYDAKYFGPRMEYVLRNTILTALSVPAPTLLTILELLTKKDYRKSVTALLPAGVLKDFWTYEFEKLGSLQRNQLISPITNKVGGILSSPLNYNILTQPRSKLDLEDVMNTGKILLCDLSKGKIGEDESSFFGSLVIAKLQLAALRRARIPEAQRRDFFLYVDEFQNFATQSFAELVSEARKYRLSTILAHQSISQIENRDIIRVILANVGSVICFRTANPEDEQFILPIFAPEVEKHDISNLPLYRFYMKVSVGKPSAAFMADVADFTVPQSEERLRSVVSHSRDQYAMKMKQDLPTPTQADSRAQNPSPSGSDSVNPSPLSLTGTEYGGDWQKVTDSTHDSIHQLILTHQQHEILLKLYRFRFLDRSHIQRLLNLTDYKNLNKLLGQLTQYQYITKITKTKEPSIYYLAANGILELKSHPKIDSQSLKKFTREHDRSNAFIQRCLMIASINLDLRAKVTNRTKYGMFVPNDYPSTKLAKELTLLSPHAFVIRHQAEQIDQMFVEVLSDLPTKYLQTQLKRYTDFFDTNAWQVATNMPFPEILLITPDQKMLTTVKRIVKQLMADFETNRPVFQIALVEKVSKHGITADICEEVT